MQPRRWKKVVRIGIYILAVALNFLQGGYYLTSLLINLVLVCIADLWRDQPKECVWRSPLQWVRRIGLIVGIYFLAVLCMLIYILICTSQPLNFPSPP